MASNSSPTFTSPSTRSAAKPHIYTFSKAKFSSRLNQSNNLNHLLLSTSNSLSRTFDSASCLCRCRNNSNDEIDPSDDSPVHNQCNSIINQVVTNAIRKMDNYLNSHRNQLSEEIDVSENVEDWDWERWCKHFDEVEVQQRIVSVLKSQITHAIAREDYQDAASLKVSAAAAATNDAVGMVISHLNKAIVEERYQEASFLRDNAGTGLVGWWSGISEDNTDPCGHIIRISAEHGRYMARRFSPRQLVTAMAGLPMFEIFLTINKKGEYKQQVVYLSPSGKPQDVSISSRGPTRTSNPLDSSGDNNNRFASPDDNGDSKKDNDSDITEGLTSFEFLLRDMIPGAEVKVLKVIVFGMLDRDVLSKVVEQFIEEEKDRESEIIDTGDEDKDESNQDQGYIEMDAGDAVVDDEEQNEISVKVVVGDALHKVPSNVLTKKMIRIPAKLERKGRMAFSFSIEKNDKQQRNVMEKSLKGKRSKLRGQRCVDQIMVDLTKIIGRGKAPMKVQNHQVLSGSTTFNRIEVSMSADPLNGLYIGSHRLASEIIHLRRKFGQWQDVGRSSEPEDLQFYEYVEAVKLTGDHFVPAGEVAFRAKIDKRYQLPHKGIIPEEFGVVARYRGQGRLAEPGFKNPQWVDGELVILDGKYIKRGPVVGFVYWARESNFWVFFNRLKLQD